MKTLKKQQLPSDMDLECIELCNAMNLFPGIRTTESCWGHGNDSYMIFFEADRIENLAPILYHFDQCHCGCYGWRVIARTDCSMRRASFLVQGPVGKQAYKDAMTIAAKLREYRSRMRLKK